MARSLLQQLPDSVNGLKLPMLRISRTPFSIMPPPMAEEETMGSRIRRAREELGLSVLALRDKIQLEFRAEIGETTLRELERDKPPNPGIKTVEMVARGLGLRPLDLIALALDEDMEDAAAKLDLDFSKTRFIWFWKAYQNSSSRKRAMVDAMLQMWTDWLSKES